MKTWHDVDAPRRDRVRIVSLQKTGGQLTGSSSLACQSPPRPLTRSLRRHTNAASLVSSFFHPTYTRGRVVF